MMRRTVAFILTLGILAGFGWMAWAALSPMAQTSQARRSPQAERIHKAAGGACEHADRQQQKPCGCVYCSLCNGADAPQEVVFALSPFPVKMNQARPVNVIWTHAVLTYALDRPPKRKA